MFLNPSGANMSGDGCRGCYMQSLALTLAHGNKFCAWETGMPHELIWTGKSQIMTFFNGTVSEINCKLWAFPAEVCVCVSVFNLTDGNRFVMLDVVDVNCLVSNIIYCIMFPKLTIWSATCERLIYPEHNTHYCTISEIYVPALNCSGLWRPK